MAFIDQGKFEAMKTLSGWEAARCDEHPFRAKIKVSTCRPIGKGPVRGGSSEPPF